MEKFIQYLKGFWSPEKIILLYSILFSWIIYRLHPLYFMHCSRVDEVEQIISCGAILGQVIVGPLAYSGLIILLFCFVLILLPLPLLHNWFKYIASWSIPLGLLLAFSTSPESSGMIGAPNFTPATMLMLMTQMWIILLAGFILVTVIRSYWKFKNNT
jgi:hypothetical protein